MNNISPGIPYPILPITTCLRLLGSVTSDLVLGIVSRKETFNNMADSKPVDPAVSCKSVPNYCVSMLMFLGHCIESRHPKARHKGHEAAQTTESSLEILRLWRKLPAATPIPQLDHFPHHHGRHYRSRHLRQARNPPRPKKMAKGRRAPCEGTYRRFKTDAEKAYGVY